MTQIMFSPSEFSLKCVDSQAPDGTIKIYNVRLETTRLVLRSVTKEDITFYENLFGNAENMKLYLDSQPKAKQWVKMRLDSWCDRWQSGNPFSAFVVELKENDKTTPIGHAVNGQWEKAGISSCAIVIDVPYWGQKFASEVTNAAVQCWFPYLFERKLEVLGRAFQKVHASAVLENVSVLLLQKFGFELDETSVKTRQLVRRDTGSTVHSDESNFFLDLPIVSPVEMIEKSSV